MLLCNLHLQKLRVQKLLPDGEQSRTYVRASTSCFLVDIIGITDESSYFVVTSGCPADHVGGFKNGGLKRMLSECRSWLVGIIVTS